jgi:hypothetical protein
MKPELPIYGLVAMLITAVSVLAGLRIPVPQDLWLLLGALVAGGLGITVPAARGATSPPGPVEALPAAPVATVVDPFTAPAAKS